MPAKIELRVGEKYPFRLKGLGAGGYRWEYGIEQTNKVVSVSSEYVDDRKRIGPLPPGYSVDVRVTIRALEPGHATIHLAQRRSWEEDKPLKEHVIEILVDG